LLTQSEHLRLDTPPYITGVITHYPTGWWLAVVDQNRDRDRLSE